MDRGLGFGGALALAALLAAVPVLSAAGAQQAAAVSPYRGVTSVQVVVEETDANDAKCGIRKADLESAAAKALQDAGVRVAGSSRTTLPVTLITLVVEPEGLCVSHVGIGLKALAYGAPWYAPDSKQTLEVLLRQERTMISSDKTEHGARVSDRVTTLAGRIAQEIVKANQ